MGLDCYGLLYETDEFGTEHCVKYMRYLRGPALDALEILGVEMDYQDSPLKNFPQYKGPLLSQERPKKVDLGGGYFIILYWI